MKRSPRRGHTLTEMVVVLTIIAGLMIAGGVLLSALLHLDRAERGFSTEAVALDRLAFEFRRDARQAIDAKTRPQGIDLIKSRGTIVTYNFDKSRVVRIETVDEIPGTPRDLQPHSQRPRPLGNRNGRRLENAQAFHSFQLEKRD